MIQVYIAEGFDYMCIEEEINNFLSNEKGIEVVDIKFSTVLFDNKQTDDEIHYSAMIIFKER